MTLDVASSDQRGGESRHNGTKALMIAILESGIRDYCGAPGRQRSQAEAWVQSGRREAFSFTVVCETLGLDPSSVRQALLRFKQQGAFARVRSRQNVRNQRLTAKSR